MTQLRTRTACALVAALLSSCGLFATPGYDPDDPSKVVCGCHDGQTCFEEATALANDKGETAETGEDLLYLTQCACFQGSVAGCNIISHFAKDWVRACERGDDVKNSCAIAGFVHHHGVLVPQINGRSFKRDPKAAAKAFARACNAGSPVCDAYH
jgi:hypothetical protein